MTYSEVQAGRVRKELAGRPGLIEKEMFGGIAFLVGGNMAVGVHGEDLIERSVEIMFDWSSAAVMSLLLLVATLVLYSIYYRITDVRRMMGA